MAKLNRITKLLYTKRGSCTVVIMQDGSNYLLPMVRDPLIVARFCGAARRGTWEISLKPEGIEALMQMPDLEVQEMSF